MQLSVQDTMKRVFDFSLSLTGLILLSPLMLLIALAVKLSSPGPVFYRGTRTGRFGKPFRIFKFRTMVANAEKLGGTTTGREDSRLTKIGRIVRSCKFDEIAQLINVLKGDMSFVGPRPEVEEYTRLFSEEEKRILSVRPGITDLSSLKFHDLQAHVGSDDPDKVFRESILPQKNALRLQYVNERSFHGDLAIILQTFFVLVTRNLRKSS